MFPVKYHFNAKLIFFFRVRLPVSNREHRLSIICQQALYYIPKCINVLIQIKIQMFHVSLKAKHGQQQIKQNGKRSWTWSRSLVLKRLPKHTKKNKASEVSILKRWCRVEWPGAPPLRRVDLRNRGEGGKGVTILWIHKENVRVHHNNWYLSFWEFRMLQNVNMSFRGQSYRTFADNHTPVDNKYWNKTGDNASRDARAREMFKLYLWTHELASFSIENLFRRETGKENVSFGHFADKGHFSGLVWPPFFRKDKDPSNKRPLLSQWTMDGQSKAINKPINGSQETEVWVKDHRKED